LDLRRVYRNLRAVAVLSAATFFVGAMLTARVAAVRGLATPAQTTPSTQATPTAMHTPSGTPGNTLAPSAASTTATPRAAKTPTETATPAASTSYGAPSVTDGSHPARGATTPGGDGVPPLVLVFLCLASAGVGAGLSAGLMSRRRVSIASASPRVGAQGSAPALTRGTPPFAPTRIPTSWPAPDDPSRYPSPPQVPLPSGYAPDLVATPAWPSRQSAPAAVEQMVGAGESDAVVRSVVGRSAYVRLGEGLWPAELSVEFEGRMPAPGQSVRAAIDRDGVLVVHPVLDRHRPQMSPSDRPGHSGPSGGEAPDVSQST
jgi:hypothetical protein